MAHPSGSSGGSGGEGGSNGDSQQWVHDRPPRRFGVFLEGGGGSQCCQSDRQRGRSVRDVLFAPRRPAAHTGIQSGKSLPPRGRVAKGEREQTLTNVRRRASGNFIFSRRSGGG